MEIDFEGFCSRTDRLMRVLGIPEETASRYASLIGDVIKLDEEGWILVIDVDGTLLARLPPDSL